MHKHNSILQRLLKEPIFVEYPIIGVAIKSNSMCAPEYYIKFKGGKEYKIEQSSLIMAKAINEAKEITREQYENY